MVDVRNLNISAKELEVSMQLAAGAAQSTVDICKKEKVGINVGVTGLCIALFSLAKKYKVPVETLVEVLREMGRDEKQQAKA